MNAQKAQPQENSTYIGTCDMNVESYQAQKNNSYFGTCDVNIQQQELTNQQINLCRKLKSMIGNDDLPSFVNWLECKLQDRENSVIQPRNDYQTHIFNNAQKFTQYQFHQNSVPSQQSSHNLASQTTLLPQMTPNQVNLPPEVTSNQVGLPSQVHVTSHVNFPPQLTSSRGSSSSQLTTNQFSFPPQFTGQVGLPQQMNTNQKFFSSHSQLGQVNPLQAPQISHNAFPQINSFVSNPNQSNYKLSGPNTDMHQINTSATFDSCLNLHQQNLQQQNSKPFRSCADIHQENCYMQLAHKPFSIDNSEKAVSSSTPYSMRNSRPVTSNPFHGNLSSSQAFMTLPEINYSRTLESSRNMYNMGNFPTQMREHNTVAYYHDGVMPRSNYLPNTPGRNPPPYAPPIKLVANLDQPTDYSSPFKKRRTRYTKKTGPMSSDEQMLRTSQYESPHLDVLNSNAGEGVFMHKWYSMPDEAKSSENTDTHSNKDENDTLACSFQNVTVASVTLSTTTQTGSTFKVNSTLVNSSVTTVPYPTVPLVSNERKVFVPSVASSSSETMNTNNVLDRTSSLQSVADPNSDTSSSNCQSLSGSSMPKMSSLHKQQNNGECKSNIFSQMLPNLVKLDSTDDDINDENSGVKNNSVIDFDSRPDEVSPNSSNGSKTSISPPLNKLSSISSEGRETSTSPFHETSPISSEGSKTFNSLPLYEVTCSPISSEGSKSTTSTPLYETTEERETTSSPLYESKTTTTTLSSIVEGKTLQEKFVVQNKTIASNLTSSTSGVQSCECPAEGNSSNDDVPLPVITYVPRRTPSSVLPTTEGEIKLTCHGINEMPVQNSMASKVSHGMAKLRYTFKKHFGDITGNADKVLPSTQYQTEHTSGKLTKSKSKDDTEIFVKTSMMDCDGKQVSEGRGSENKVKKSSDCDTKLKKHDKDKASIKKSDCLLKVKLPFQHDRHCNGHKSNSTKKRFQSDVDTGDHAVKKSKPDEHHKRHSHSKHSNKVTDTHKPASLKKHNSGKHKNKSFSEKQIKTCENPGTRKHSEVKRKSNEKHCGKSNKSKSVVGKSSSKKLHNNKRSFSKTPKMGQSCRESAVDITKSSNNQNTDAHKYECCSLECDTTKFPSHPELSVVHYHGNSLMCINLPNGKYFVMKEFVVKCFTDTPRVKVYQIKTKVLNVKHCELDHYCRKEVIRYLIDVNKEHPMCGISNIKSILPHTEDVDTGPLYLGIILVKDAEKLYHYLNPLDKEIMDKNVSVLSKVKDRIALTSEEKEVDVSCEKPALVSQCNNKVASIVNSDCHPIDNALIANISNQEVSEGLKSAENFSEHNKDCTVTTISLDNQDVDDENSSISSDCTVIYCDGLPVDKTNSSKTDICEKQLSMDTCCKTMSSELTVEAGVELMQGVTIRFLQQERTKWYLIEDLYPIFGEQEVLSLVQSKSIVLKSCTEQQFQYFSGSTSLSDDPGYLLNEDSLQAITSSINQTSADSCVDSSNHCCIDQDELNTVPSRHDEIVIYSDSEEDLSLDAGNCVLEKPIDSSPIPVVLSRTCCDGSSGTCNCVSRCGDSSSDTNDLHETRDSSETCVAPDRNSDASSVTVVASPRTLNDLSETCDGSVVTCDGSSGTSDDLSKNSVHLSDTRVTSSLICDTISETNRSFGCDDSSYLCDGLSVTDNRSSRVENGLSMIHEKSSRSLLVELLEENDTLPSLDWANHNSTVKNNSESHVPCCDRMLEETEHSSRNNGHNSLDHSKSEEPQIKTSTIPNDKICDNKEENNQKGFVNESLKNKVQSHMGKTVDGFTTGCVTEPLRVNEDVLAEGDASQKVHKENPNQFIPQSENKQVHKQGTNGCRELNGRFSTSPFSQDTSISHFIASSVHDSSITCSADQACVSNNSVLPIDTQIPQEVNEEISAPELTSEMVDKMKLVSEQFVGLSRETILNSVVHLCERIYYLQNENQTLNSEVTRLTTLNTNLQSGVEHYKNMVKEFTMTFKDAEDD